MRVQRILQTRLHHVYKGGGISPRNRSGGGNDACERVSLPVCMIVSPNRVLPLARYAEGQAINP